MQKLLNWFDKHLLEIGIVFFIVFFPLYPKLPLIDIVHTWVYIRLEDFIVLAVVGIWLVQVFRKKISLRLPLFWSVVAYWLVGAISLLNAIFILKPHLANFFSHIAVLHYLRRIEYMIFFFIVGSTIKNLKIVKRYLFFIILAFFAVCLYGFGQKFLGFPAFLTMNEEFAKGIPLYLPPTARITSTFAGHYDLAAYLVLMISLLVSLIFGVRKLFLKILLGFLAFLGFFLLLFTASRISFFAYLLAVSIVLVYQKRKWLVIPVVILSVFLMQVVGGGTKIRFGKTLRVEPVVFEKKTGKPIATLEQFTATPTPTPAMITKKKMPQPTPPPSPSTGGEDLPSGTSFIALPILSKKQKEEVYFKSLKTATVSSQIATTSGEFLLTTGDYFVKKALVYDISFTTRFQGEWPRALKAFKRNLLLGSGFSSISLATDNDYLRLLGETGLLGFSAFMAILFSFFLLLRQNLSQLRNHFVKSILIGILSGTMGLMFNAVLIDVFEASKVAFSFWILLGLAVGLINFYFPKRKSLFKEALAVIQLPAVAIIFLTGVGLFVFWPTFKNYFVADDFTWLYWAATAKATDLGNFFLDAQGFFYRPLSKIYFFFVYPVFNLNPQGYHLFDLFVHLAVVIGVYLLSLQLTQKKLVSLLTALLFLIHPVHTETVLWISSTSILLARFFYLFAFLSYLFYSQQKKLKPLFYLFSLLLFVFGLVSHELIVTFPLLILFYDFLFKRVKITAHLPFWFLTAGYFYLRNVVAQAHWLSGDYNYNLAKLPFNFAGNLLGYLAELLFGFRSLSFYYSARFFLRQQKLIAFGLLLIGFLLMIRVIRKIKFNRIIIFLLGWFIILLLPVLGLGNIAERYVYLADFAVFSLIGLFIDWLVKQTFKSKLALRICLFSLISLGLSIFYYSQFAKEKENWYQAGETAHKILLALGSNYSDFPPGSTLYFVKLPLRQNRAWIFPVGLKDGIWFIYRDENLAIKKAKSVKEALGLTKGKPHQYIFVYENNALQEVKR